MNRKKLENQMKGVASNVVSPLILSQSALIATLHNNGHIDADRYIDDTKALINKNIKDRELRELYMIGLNAISVILEDFKENDNGNNSK